jgi:pentatricopeptide repeat domain-containing protein 1
VYFYTTAMDACAKEGGRRWMAEALSLLDEMVGRGLVPNEVTYGVAVTACGNGGRWEEALDLLDRMRTGGLRINTITYNSAIAALSKAARGGASSSSNNPAAVDADVLWEKALHLIKCMEDEGIRRDSFTYSSAIGVCGAGGRWREAVDLIGKMKGDGARPNRVAFTSAITACAGSR